MGLIIVVGIMAVIMIAGIIYSFHHFGGETPAQRKMKEEEAKKRLAPKKILKGKIIEIKTVNVSGMETDESKKLVEGHIDRIYGAASAADIKKGLVKVWLERTVMDSDIIVAVGQAGFKVTGISSREPLPEDTDL